MTRIPQQIIREAIMAKWAEEIGPEAARVKALSDLQAGAVPPWQQKEISLTSYLVRKRLRDELPEPEKEGGRLYVLGFQGLRAVVKVGSTAAPERQFEKYETQARNLGYALVDGWVSAPVGTRSEAYRLEAMVLTNLHLFLNGHIDGGRIFEWFHGHDFEQIRQLVENPTELLHLTLERALARRSSRLTHLGAAAAAPLGTAIR
ncbi:MULTISPECIES: hypothetical protein [Streptomyces]|uniref:Uncharacterized protein n=2 Tax=Streptomyces TaxID=1883 RepID=A0A2U9PAL7_STRAS|nr:hypothetical protein [Streptomyces actuosus]AWT46810.1 hypothetical protein DMT42_34070 [Streptomyces actuosus]MBM4824045.1 hypothetical protein [Streptomyces actuosus]